uniref:Uncharacterized protein n=1 Tax=Setaria viridis TaxID=4556 RepID=A0A4V6DCV7_SETVI|nr:hypothetical protein SEVIR_1G155450v2 [Setaria viridis]
MTSEAGTSSGREMVLFPSMRIEPNIEIRVLLEEVQLIDDPLLDAQTVATILEMNRHVTSYTEDLINRSYWKSQLLRDYGETVQCAVVLEKELVEER